MFKYFFYIALLGGVLGLTQQCDSVDESADNKQIPITVHEGTQDKENPMNADQDLNHTDERMDSTKKEKHIVGGPCAYELFYLPALIKTTKEVGQNYEFEIVIWKNGEEEQRRVRMPKDNSDINAIDTITYKAREIIQGTCNPIQEATLLFDQTYKNQPEK